MLKKYLRVLNFKVMVADEKMKKISASEHLEKKCDRKEIQRETIKNRNAPPPIALKGDKRIISVFAKFY